MSDILPPRRPRFPTRTTLAPRRRSQMNAPFHFVPHAEPFFFDVDPGTRFCVYHPSGTEVAPRGAILYVHPFADELNLCRRMAATTTGAAASTMLCVRW